jgi:hypothetical protein
MATDARQLLLQVDASVAVAQRNLQSLARQVANDATAMDASLSRVDKAFSRIGKSAEDSAQAFIAGDKAAKGLLASIDPLFAAQHRYDTELEKANQLYKTGSLSAQEFAKVQAGLKSQLDSQIGSFGRVGGASGQLRSGMQQLSFQIGDVAQGFALGVRPMTIFAQQGGQVIQTLQLMGGGTNKFLSILAGPWGLALSVATSLLVLLSSRHKDAAESVSDLVAKMKKEADQASLNERANKIWANSIDGVREAQKKLRDEIEQSIRVEAIQNRQNLDAAQKRLEGQQGQLADRERQLAGLKQRRSGIASGLENPLITPEDEAAIRAALARVDGQIAKVNEDIGKLKSGIVESQRTIRDASIPIARDMADAAASASAALTQLYDVARGRIEETAKTNQKLADSLAPVESALERARKASDEAASAGASIKGVGTNIVSLTQALVQGKIGPDAYTKSVNAMAKSLDAAAKAARDAKKGVGEFGKQIGFDEAAQIAKSAGLTVTSAYRSTAKQASLYNDPSVNRPGNPVARPGTSAHEGINGKWALDIAFADGLTPEKLKKIYGSQGVSLTAVYKEKGHFHIEGSRSNAAASERSAQSEQARQIRNDNSFEERSDQLNDQLLQAQMALVDDTQRQAEYAEELVRAEAKRAENAIQNDVEEGKLSQAQADILKGKVEQVAAQKIANIEVQKQINALRDQDQSDQDSYEFAIELLHNKESLAKTTNERKTIEKQILDLVYQEKEEHLKSLKAQAELAGNVAEAARLQEQINRLPAEKASQGRVIDQQNRGPLQTYLDGIPQTADQVNEALQNVEVEGLNGLVNGISAVVSGTQSMGDAFRQVAQDMIAQITAIIVKMLVLKAIQAVTGTGGMDFGMGAGLLGTGTSPFAAGGASFGSAAGMDFGLGSGLLGGGGSVFAGAIPAFASGGAMTLGGMGGGDSNVLSLNGKPLAMVTRGETLAVIPRVPKVSVPANSNGDSHYHISVMAPNTGDPRRDRRTALQQAGMVREAVATVSRKGA